MEISKKDLEEGNFMFEVTKGELEEAKKKKADRCLRIARRKIRKSSAYRSGNIVRCRQGDIWTDLKEEDSLDEKTDYSKEKEQGLHGWFARQGGKGKSKGWVDCNTCRDGKCKSCGRKEGESRAKYPACRPTPSACKTKGKGKSWGKKSKLNEDNQYLLPEEINEKVHIGVLSVSNQKYIAIHSSDDEKYSFDFYCEKYTINYKICLRMYMFGKLVENPDF